MGVASMRTLRPFSSPVRAAHCVSVSAICFQTPGPMREMFSARVERLGAFWKEKRQKSRSVRESSSAKVRRS